MSSLTPGTSYMCKTPNGQISWDNASSTLTLTGTVFIDGSAKVDNGRTNLYTGSGVLYLSGSFLLKNSKLCALSSTSSPTACIPWPGCWTSATTTPPSSTPSSRPARFGPPRFPSIPYPAAIKVEPPGKELDRAAPAAI